MDKSGKKPIWVGPVFALHDIIKKPICRTMKNSQWNLLLVSKPEFRMEEILVLFFIQITYTHIHTFFRT